MFRVHGLGELGSRNLATSVLVSARYRIYGDRADVDGAEDVVKGPSELLGGTPQASDVTHLLSSSNLTQNNNEKRIKCDCEVKSLSIQELESISHSV